MLEEVEAPDLSGESKGEVSKSRLSRYEAVYRGIWEDEAPPGYLESVAASMNLVEFEAHEKAKPAFAYSPLFKEQEQALEAGSGASLERLKHGSN